MRTLFNVLPSSQYPLLQARSAEIVKAYKTSLENGELTRLEKFKRPPIVPRGNPNDPAVSARIDAFIAEAAERQEVAYGVIKSLVSANHPEIAKTGVTTSLGYNFYDLRGPVQLLYPVNVHFRNTIPRIGRQNDGVGTAAHWMAVRNPGSAYAGVSEGQRNARGTPDNNPYIASYKELGVERGVTFTAQFAGEGYVDNLADEHLRGLHSLFLQEEGIILLGNAGSDSGNNGFKLGTAATPTAAANNTAATLNSGSTVSACVVLLTAMGNPQNTQYGYGVYPTVAGGLTPSYSRTNADGSRDTIPGGMSAVSAMSAVITTDGSNPSVKFSVPAANKPCKGVFGYAWFVNVTDASNPAKANAKLYAITTKPEVIVSAAPASDAQTAAATGLDADHSFCTLDFDGLLTYAAKSGGWVDLYGGSLTSEKNGRVTQIETALESIWTNYQAGVDEIWCSTDAALALDAAVRYSGTTATGYQFMTTRDNQNNMLAGFVVSAYQSRFAFNSPTGANAIPIRIHPMLPPGTIYFHITTNPYPHSRIPYVQGMLVQREYYSIEWPQVTREWPFGTYVHEVLAHNLPWIPYVLTGIGTFVGS